MAPVLLYYFTRIPFPNCPILRPLLSLHPTVQTDTVQYLSNKSTRAFSYRLFPTATAEQKPSAHGRPSSPSIFGPSFRPPPMKPQHGLSAIHGDILISTKIVDAQRSRKRLLGMPFDLTDHQHTGFGRYSDWTGYADLATNYLRL